MFILHILLFFIIYKYIFSGKVYKVDINSLNYKKLNSRRLKSHNFLPPYPNGWIFVCNSKDIKKNQLKELNILHHDMVMFRNENNKIGVIYKYCSHLGTNLSGGKVISNNLVCPYHSWEFDIDGNCKNIPYCKNKLDSVLTPRLNTKKFFTLEKNNMIFVWYHSSNKEPKDEDYDINIFQEIDHKYFYTQSVDFMDFHMHIFEPSQNSADPIHFTTVHKHLAIVPGSRLINADHIIKSQYNNLIKNDDNIKKDDNHEKIDNHKIDNHKIDNHKIDNNYIIHKNSIIINEKITSMRLFNYIKLPNFLNTLFSTIVIIESPSLVLFRIDSFLGNYRAIMTLTPIAPFHQKLKLNVWCKGLIVLFSKVLTYFVMNTVYQDKEVWENKMHVKPRNIVSGDGPFASYSKWLDQFYDSNSKKAIDISNNFDW